MFATVCSMSLPIKRKHSQKVKNTKGNDRKESYARTLPPLYAHFRLHIVRFNIDIAHLLLSLSCSTFHPSSYSW